MEETWVQSLSQVDPYRRKWQPALSLAWKIPWTEEPGGPQSMGLQRVGHDRATKQRALRIYVKRDLDILRSSES